MNLHSINMRIQNEICHDTISKLKDCNLFENYTKCVSVKNKTERLKNILHKHNVDDDKIQSIIQDYVLELIPAGTKGVIKGNMFNTIIKKYILSMKLDEAQLDISFEKQCENHITEEIPDWYIMDKRNGKILIGMNQLDLWGGGHQSNRGSKYIINNCHNYGKSKLVCVICNDVKIKKIGTKIYKLFDIGFNNNTLCYIKNLQNIITSYFDI